MSVSEITKREQIAGFLQQGRVVNAYSLGYLDPRYADECKWYGHREDGELTSLALVYNGLSRPGLFTTGRHEDIKHVLNAFGNELPERVTAHFPPDHRASVESAFKLGNGIRRMNRMGLSRALFTDPGSSDIQVDVLSHRDTAGIMQLYAYWQDHFFEPYQLESRLYFGVRSEGQLVSIAGVHNVSETFDVAAIGNLVTHPDFRGTGLAIACTAHLLRAVFERVGLVTLDVEDNNEPAMRTYKRFGFEHYGDFFEAEMARR